MAKRKKVQKDKQRFTKHTYKTTDRVTRTPLKTGGELRFTGRENVGTGLITCCRYTWMHTPILIF
jgi:hypothetical protein